MTTRRQPGKPLSPNPNALAGAVLGAVIGAATLGPPGAIGFGILGALIGQSIKPPKLPPKRR